MQKKNLTKASISHFHVVFFCFFVVFFCFVLFCFCFCFCFVFFFLGGGGTMEVVFSSEWNGASTKLECFIYRMEIIAIDLES